MAKVNNINRVESINNCSSSNFKENIYPHRVPFILRKNDIGEASTKWSPDYLSDVIGEVPVKVHVSPVPKMNFVKKNFIYKTLTFSEFIKRANKDLQTDYFICPEEKYYLRSLGTDPRKDVADITKQYPKLAEDLKIPDFFEHDKFFSSVFRISSSGTQLWTHYDVMDNILIHLIGRKRVVLFPPVDAENLYMCGDKSQIMEIDNPNYEEFPKFQNVNWYECILEPGDILFIPALWFHNVTALDYSISVNVFWKHLDDSCYDMKDVYGNNDLLVAQRASQGVDKALKVLDTLPNDYRLFYSQMLVERIYKKMKKEGTPS